MVIIQRRYSICESVRRSVESGGRVCARRRRLGEIIIVPICFIAKPIRKIPIGISPNIFKCEFVGRRRSCFNEVKKYTYIMCFKEPADDNALP